MRIPRRRVLQLLCAGAATAGGIARAGVAPAVAAERTTLGDARIALVVDGRLHTQVRWTPAGRAMALTAMEPSEFVRLADGAPVTDFAFQSHVTEPVDDVHGPGTRHVVTGRSAIGLEKTLIVTFYARHPGVALVKARFRNASPAAIRLGGWTVAQHCLPVAKPATEPAFWSFSGASHEDRRDWVQPVKAGFKQRNHLGMNASDYGGGTPVVDVWRPDAGLAVGHVEPHPALVAVPIAHSANGATVGVDVEKSRTLGSGDTVESLTCFIHAHRGDYFVTLENYRRLMADEGLAAPAAPAAAFAPIWCAWGYERNFTLAEVEGTLDKARDLGLEWVVLDDGWQTSEGDWHIDRQKFPLGEADMAAFAKRVTAAGMKPRLWLSPLAVKPGTDLLHDHVDMLLLDKNGAVQNISWWNAFTMCPAYAPTVEHHVRLVEKIIGQWGYAGLKLDGQHLNGVAPCYNPAHRHARPEESMEQLGAFWTALYDAARRKNPEAVIELCPCGTSFDFHNIVAMNQTPAADPESSWQVRHKGKTLKALLGAGGAFAGDHVELSEHGDDFASTVGIGAVVSTKFTWPADTLHPSAPQPPGGYRLTEEKEAKWRHWIALYRERMLPKGQYLGALYDIGFDKPEAHVIEKDGRLHYAFYATEWHGPIEIRGLGAARYRLRNYVDGVDLGTVSATANRIDVSFRGHLLLEAIPA